MPLPLSTDSCSFPLASTLMALVTDEILKAQIPLTQGATLNFRDPDYSPEKGGYHPVEIAINPKGGIIYITDFSFVGRPPFAELAKELDFDFGLQLFGHMGVDFPMQEGREIFRIWQLNFVAYYKSGVYQVEVQGDD